MLLFLELLPLTTNAPSRRGPDWDREERDSGEGEEETDGDSKASTGAGISSTWRAGGIAMASMTDIVPTRTEHQETSSPWSPFASQLRLTVLMPRSPREKIKRGTMGLPRRASLSPGTCSCSSEFFTSFAIINTACMAPTDIRT